MLRRLILLGGSIVLLLIGALLMYIFPPLANMISEFCWGLVGEVHNGFIGRAAEIVKQLLQQKENHVDAMISGFWLLLSTEIISAILMGSCIFILKSIFTRFNRNYIGSLLYPQWQINLLGVCLGVAVNSMISAAAPEVAGALLRSGLSLGLVLLGIGIMLGFKGRRIDPNKKSHRRFRRAHLGYITTLVLGVLGNAFNAILAVYFTAGYMIGPSLIHNGQGSGIGLFGLCASSLFLMWVMDVILNLLGEMSRS